MRSAPWCVVLVSAMACGGSCERRVPEDSAALRVALKDALGERERKVRSYRLVGVTTEVGRRAETEVLYRAPDRIRGTVAMAESAAGPVGPKMTYSFDGRMLFELDEGQRALKIHRLPETAEQATLLLARLFDPFMPEGYKLPLFKKTGTTVRRISHPRGPEALAIEVGASGDSADAVKAVTVLRWPAMDFLEKTLHTSFGTARVETVEEYCDARLRLCFPRVLQHSLDEAPGARVELSSVEVNAQVSADAFTLQAPAGFTVLQAER